MRLSVILIVFFLFIGFSSCNNKKDSGEVQVTIDQIIDQITEPEITGESLLLSDFGAKGDTVSDNKQAFDKAINTLKQQGGGRLIVSKGVYQVNGSIHLISNMELHLEEGAILKFGSNPSDYLPVVKTSWEGTFLYNYSPFIYAIGCENIAITGKGTIDGESENTWQLWKEKQGDSQQLSRDMNHKRTPIEERIFGEGHYLRPHLIQFFDCKNIKVENIKMEDSPFWCLHLLRCENVTVRGVRYDAHNKNNDGIDPEMTRNVLIEDVYFNNGDDNVAIKAGRDDDGRASEVGSENIVVRNCHFQGLHALVIGSEMSAGVQNVFVKDCTFGGDLKRGIYLKSNPDRGGFIRNLYVENVDFGKTEDCIYITSYYHNEGEGHQTDISNIHFTNITCKKATGTAIVIQGFPEKKVRDVYFTNVEIKKAKNALSMENAENIVMSDVLIGKLATSPTYVQ
ncbi:MAG: glycoside hydrolase family 28 protein [Prolixibacteraceae bacterium]|jgi:polygalacturonase|nr:glycoside hydrolase family 28 protein [Prolixibacteraceae bacterium]